MMDNSSNVHPQAAETNAPMLLEVEKLSPNNVPEFVALAVEAYASSATYDDVPIDVRRIDSLLVGNMHNPELYARLYRDPMEGHAVGAFIGQLSTLVFSNEKIAYDHAVYVTRRWRSLEQFRNMTEAFVSWAKASGAIKVFMSNTSGHKVEEHSRLLAAFGFTEVGRNMAKELR